MMATEETLKQLQNKAITTQDQIFVAMVDALLDLKSEMGEINLMLGHIMIELRELRTEVRTMNMDRRKEG